MPITLNIDQLIRFYDHADKEGNSRHSSAITGVLGESLGLGLLRHCFEAQHFRVSFGSDTPRNNRCWLDAWLLVENGAERHLYRVEVKNWSVHSLGGKELLIDADAKATSDYALARWGILVDATTKSLRHDNLAKVLLPGYEANLPVNWPPRPVPASRPLACLWTVVHPDGDTEPFFTRAVRHPETPPMQPLIDCVFFSMSAYLRTLRNQPVPLTTITLDLPLLDARLAAINRLLETGLPAFTQLAQNLPAQV